MVVDFHLHTCASDGVMQPSVLVARAAAYGVTHMAITDHDTLAAYRLGGGAVFEEARRLDVGLTVGIELDVLMDGREVHLLGLGLDRGAPALVTHLEEVARARHARARREMGIVHRELGEDALREEEVFTPERAVIMRPHFIRPLVARGRFRSYQEGREWFEFHSTTDSHVPKPDVGEAIGMIHGAGGTAALAHPAYYQKDGVPILDRLQGLRSLGLDAVELDYPYASGSPGLFAPGEIEGFKDALRERGERLGLRFTRGSDAHSPEDLDRVYGPAPV
jgi:predicted metal-dependent phosphoesterase TrpH